VNAQSWRDTISRHLVEDMEDMKAMAIPADQTPGQLAGQRAYEAYCVTVGRKTHDGKDIPQWSDLAERTREGWQAAASASPIPPSDLLYNAWTVIANVGVHRGGWDTQHDDWRDAAERWRDRWHATLQPPTGDLCPNGCGAIPHVTDGCRCERLDVVPEPMPITTQITVTDDSDRS
jgi:hypothetical protein